MIVFLLTSALFIQPSAKPVPDGDVQRVAMAGWVAARALASKGGAIDQLGPVNERLKELDRMPNIAARYADSAHLLLHSSRRADGIILEALIGDQPQNDLIPKIVRGLLGQHPSVRREPAEVVLGRRGD